MNTTNNTIINITDRTYFDRTRLNDLCYDIKEYILKPYLKTHLCAGMMTPGYQSQILLHTTTPITNIRANTNIFVQSCGTLAEYTTNGEFLSTITVPNITNFDISSCGAMIALSAADEVIYMSTGYEFESYFDDGELFTVPTSVHFDPYGNIILFDQDIKIFAPASAPRPGLLLGIVVLDMPPHTLCDVNTRGEIILISGYMVTVVYDIKFGIEIKNVEDEVCGEQYTEDDESFTTYKIKKYELTHTANCFAVDACGQIVIAWCQRLYFYNRDLTLICSYDTPIIDATSICIMSSGKICIAERESIIII